MCYFKKPSTWETVYVWAWDSNNNDSQCTSASVWPGEQLTETDANGYYIWTATLGTPTKIIFSDNDKNRTNSLDFTMERSIALTEALRTMCPRQSTFTALWPREAGL